jgi:hypothetical protein
MTAAAVIGETLKGLSGEDDLFELSRLLAPVSSADQVVINNVMTSEEEANIILSLISEQEIQHLNLVPAGEVGHQDLMREDYFPCIGRVLCRLAHSVGYKVYLAPVNKWHQPEAVIVTPEGFCIQLLIGEKRQRQHEKPDMDFMREQLQERVTAVSGH